jgi:hypothetical protein
MYLPKTNLFRHLFRLFYFPPPGHAAVQNAHFPENQHDKLLLMLSWQYILFLQLEQGQINGGGGCNQFEPAEQLKTTGMAIAVKHISIPSGSLVCI